MVIYKALEVILIFGAGGVTDERTDEGVLRGPRGPKNCILTIALQPLDYTMHYKALVQIYATTHGGAHSCPFDMLTPFFVLLKPRGSPKKPIVHWWSTNVWGNLFLPQNLSEVQKQGKTFSCLVCF